MRLENGGLPPKAILFDLDGTLFDRESSYLELVEAQYERFAEALSHVPRETYVQRAVELDAHGYVERSVVYGGLAREFDLPEGLAQELTRHFWESYHLFGRAFSEVTPALPRLRAFGLKLGIITNGSVRMQERKIEQLRLPRVFDAVLISEREGVRKPDPSIFEVGATPPPNNMCVLKGFPTTPNSSATSVAYPFGMWFADANTLYGADEGDEYAGGTDLYTHAATQTTAGLQKWVFNSGTGS